MIPTAKELFQKYSNLCQFEEGDPEYLIDEEDFQRAAIEFAKPHVEAALKAAAEQAKTTTRGDYEDSIGVDTQSILNAYPLTNIK